MIGPAGSAILGLVLSAIGLGWLLAVLWYGLIGDWLDRRRARSVPEANL